MSANSLLAVLILSCLEEEVERIEEEAVDAVAMDVEVLAFVAGGVDVVVVESVEPIMVSLSQFESFAVSVDVAITDSDGGRSLLVVSLLVLLLCVCVRSVTVFIFVFFFVFDDVFNRSSRSSLTSLSSSLLEVEKSEESDEARSTGSCFWVPFFVLRMLELGFCFCLFLRTVRVPVDELSMDVEASSQSGPLSFSWMGVVRPLALSL